MEERWGAQSVRPRPRLLARHVPAWVIGGVVVVIGQVVMWRGWNASGEWEPITGRDAVVSAVLLGALAALPLVVALFLLRRWISLGAVVLGSLVIAVGTGSFFDASTSSTAGFAWFRPLIYGLPVVAVVAIAEGLGERMAGTVRRPRR